MNQILVPVDFSDYAYNAAVYSLHLASKYNVGVTLLHAYHIPIVDPLMPTEYLSDLAASAEKEISENMNSLVEKLRNENNKVQINHKVTMGFAVDEIITACEKLNPDLIVMGRRYTEGMTKILLGSITSAVIEKATVPVIVIPENVTPGTRISSVLYASEFDEDDEKTINTLLKFTKPLKAKIHFVHILSESDKDSRKHLERLQKKFENEFKRDEIDFQNVYSESVTEGLLNFVDRHKINLMAMLTHKRNFFVKLFDSSITQKIAFKSNVPLLVFHSKK